MAAAIPVLTVYALFNAIPRLSVESFLHVATRRIAFVMWLLKVVLFVSTLLVTLVIILNALKALIAPLVRVVLRIPAAARPFAFRLAPAKIPRQ